MILSLLIQLPMKLYNNPEYILTLRKLLIDEHNERFDKRNRNSDLLRANQKADSLTVLRKIKRTNAPQL